jgi:hypothetical protein
MSPELCWDDNEASKKSERGFSMGHEFVCDLSNLSVTLLDPKIYKSGKNFPKGLYGPKYNPVENAQNQKKYAHSKPKVVMEKSIAKTPTNSHNAIKKK